MISFLNFAEPVTLVRSPILTNWAVEVVVILFLLPSRLREGSGEGLTRRATCGRTAPPPAPPASGRGAYAAIVIGSSPARRVFTAGTGTLRGGSSATALAIAAM